jgi:hypothetical protein
LKEVGNKGEKGNEGKEKERVIERKYVHTL